MTHTYNVGIIGVGGVGEVLLKAFQEHPRTNVIAIHDANQAKMQEMSGKYHLPSFPDYHELLANEEIDVVYLAVPPKFHHAIALDIIRSGKHILCEKPLANSVQEAREMLEEAERASVIHGMNFPTIYRPAFRKLQDFVKSRRIGNIQEIELICQFSQWPRPWQQNDWISSREQGGFVKEVFPHYIQMIGMMFGGLAFSHSSITYPEDPSLSEISILAKGTTLGGIPIAVKGTVDDRLAEAITFTVKGDNSAMTLKNWKELWEITGDGQTKEVQLPAENHLALLIDHFLQHLEGKPAVTVTFREGYQVQVVLESLIQIDAVYNGK
ncbi:Gfo/Idh/MocA family protein [Brevibacillus migulae]|uniref:Gfo/Idh/MocA family protein n=1 Tax=Brevibacillus migulae TaxID=1644114 RepID=UPI0014322818|nr:Gfo/Idh/MocA family oxidoreductase [Brevibacillus migulae]